MLNRILELSLNNRFLVLMTAVVLSVSGVYVIKSMDVDVFPDLTAPTVTVMTESHGMEAEEVERLVTLQIETGLNGSPDVRRIRSSSAAGISIVWVEFEWGTDIYKARQIVSEKIPSIKEKLPSGVGEPTLSPVSSIMGEVMLLSVSSDSLSPMELRTIADWDIRQRIKAISGISNVVVIGGEFKQYQILASPAKMDYYGVSLKELEEAARASNINATGGFYSEFGNQYIIKGQGRIQNTEEIAASFVKLKGGQPITIGDVAEVKIGSADKIGDGSMNGKSAVILTITKQPETNTLDLTKALDQAVAEMKTSLPKGIQINNQIFRQGDFIEGSVNNLRTTLLEGALFVVIVLFIFLMNWRTTVISLLAIPLSLVVSFIVLKAFGYTLNTMSLGGMAIAIGALVDDAIIDVENVFKRLRESVLKPVSDRKPVIRVVLDASREIRSSIIIATLIIIVSFVPLFFLGGMEGKLLKPLGIAFVTSVLTSLLIAITVTPVLCSYLLKNEKLLLKQSQGTKAERFLQKYYGKALSKFLNYPKMTIGGTVVIFFISIFFALGLGRSFLPEFNEGSLVISVVGPPAMSLEESNKIGLMTEGILLSMPEIDIVTRRTGRAELDEHAQGVNAAELDAPFHLSERSKEAFLDELRSRLTNVPGVNITIGMPIAHRIDHMLSGTRANIAIKVFGTDLNKLFTTCNEIKDNISDVEGIVDVNVEQQIEVPQIRIVPNREMLARNGLTVYDFTEFIDVAFAGEPVSEVYEGQKSFDMVVRYDTTSRGGIEKMKNALIDLPNGTKIALKQIAKVKSVSSPHTINRENVQRKVVVSANVSERDLRGAVTEIQELISENVQLPTGYRIEYGGQFESEEKASSLLLVSSILAALLIFVLLYFEFKDLKLSAIVLLNLPLALIGGIFIVYFTSGIISIASTIGFISLFGIATRNGILLISRYQALQKSEMKKIDLIMKGSIDRLNPILMTALTTALALIPLALKGNEAGNEIQSPMAVVILGGLLTATFLNVFVVPCVYSLIDNRKDTD
ncbi:MAG: efflux RND transporter permease subunit [Crocinitomicaceae bacterium]|nr:efflux RND transporter permease subunit [Flavobacteriales bacterium]NQZ37831.1 efflux RND transporter permease subunit [Crocinitomicaceae bacterium]